MSTPKSLELPEPKTKRTLIKFICTTSRPTIFFMVNESMEQLLMLDGNENKRMTHKYLSRFVKVTTELFRYEP